MRPAREAASTRPPVMGNVYRTVGPDAVEITVALAGLTGSGAMPFRTSALAIAGSMVRRVRTPSSETVAADAAVGTARAANAAAAAAAVRTVGTDTVEPPRG